MHVGRICISYEQQPGSSQHTCQKLHNTDQSQVYIALWHDCDKCVDSVHTKQAAVVVHYTVWPGPHCEKHRTACFVTPATSCAASSVEAVTSLILAAEDCDVKFSIESNMMFSGTGTPAAALLCCSRVYGQPTLEPASKNLQGLYCCTTNHRLCNASYLVVTYVYITIILVEHAWQLPCKALVVKLTVRPEV